MTLPKGYKSPPRDEEMKDYVSLSREERQRFSDPGREQKNENLDHFTMILRDVTFKIAKTGKKDVAAQTLASFLWGYNNLIDQKNIEAQIKDSLNNDDNEKLSVIISTVIKEAKINNDFWDKMDKQFYDILRESKKGFRINTIINIILVIIGTALVVNSIVYTWMKGIDSWSLFSGGIGIGTLVSLFFYRSQDAISKAVANLSIIDMVFKSHYRAYESITDYDYRADTGNKKRDIEELKSMLIILESTTKRYVDLIQELLLIEKESQRKQK